MCRIDLCLELLTFFRLTEISEEPPTIAPSPTPPHLVTVGDDSAEEEPKESEPTPSRPPRSVPSHRIKDIVAEAKQSVSLRISPEVDEISDNGKASPILPVEPSPPLCEIREVLREAHFSKPNTTAHATRTFNDEQTPIIGKITLTVGVSYILFEFMFSAKISRIGHEM